MDLPERWRHTIGVARRAEGVLGTIEVPGDGEILLAAAWLHDIGYAAELCDTGFHPLDGAEHLAALGWPARIVGLVAHHSAAWCVAQFLGLAGELDRFPREESPVSDALIYADQTVSQSGRAMTVEQRLAEMVNRHGPDSPQAAAHPLRAPLVLAAVLRVERQLSRPTSSSVLTEFPG